MSTKLNVRVIAFTQFIDVPGELLDIEDRHINLGQDVGSDAARLIECAGRNCYDSYGIGRPSREFHENILKVGHGSVLAHSSITFYIEGISRGLSHELVRHGVGTAISQRSTRYVDESESDWVPHPLLQQLWDADITDVDQLEDQLESKQIFEMVERYSKVRYKALVPILERYLQRKGVDKQTARKQARGAARGILGNALETTMVWTANLRALRNVIEQRASRFADAEIRLLGNLLLKLAWGVCPEYFSDYSEKNCKDGIGFGVETECRKI